MMDRLSAFIEENLNGYSLPPDTLAEIRSVLLKRFGLRFSEGLSPEGRLAMEQAAKREVESARAARGVKQSVSFAPQYTSKEDTDRKHTKTTKFHESYDKSSSGRLDGDITDKTFREMDLKKRAIGGKTENAFETIEIVTYGEDNMSPKDEIDKDRRLSVEKCLIWMEVNGDGPTPSIPGSEDSGNDGQT